MTHSDRSCSGDASGINPWILAKLTCRTASRPLSLHSVGSRLAHAFGPPMPAFARSLCEPQPQDDSMMRLALGMAREAFSLGEIPVGALVIWEGRVISQAYNLRETLHDPTAHAERVALTLAGRSLGRWRLDGCTIYVTLEPCPMCAGAIGLSRVDRMVYGAIDAKAGACRSLYRLVDDPRLNHRVCQTAGVLAEECGALLSEFFKNRRSESLTNPRRGA